MLVRLSAAIAVAAVLLTLSPNLLNAQDTDASNAYWYVMMWRLESFDKVDSLRTQVDRYQRSLIDANRAQN